MAPRHVRTSTGFGLAGHGYELAEASGVTLDITVNTLPLLPGTIECLRGGHLTRANETNADHTGPVTLVDEDVDTMLLGVVYDPQTSGGLLISLPSDRASAFAQACADEGVTATRIGDVRERAEHVLRFRA